MDKIVNFLILFPLTLIIIQNNFNSFSLIDLYQNATLPDCFQGDRLRVIGNCWNKQNIIYVTCVTCICIADERLNRRKDSHSYLRNQTVCEKELKKIQADFFFSGFSPTVWLRR